MRLENVAIWARDLEKLRGFYETYFGASAGPKYRNEKKGFSSYFVSFPGGGRLELMQRPDIKPVPTSGPDRLGDEYSGYAHFAFEVATASPARSPETTSTCGPTSWPSVTIRSST